MKHMTRISIWRLDLLILTIRRNRCHKVRFLSVFKNAIVGYISRQNWQKLTWVTYIEIIMKKTLKLFIRILVIFEKWNLNVKFLIFKINLNITFDFDLDSMLNDCFSALRSCTGVFDKMTGIMQSKHEHKLSHMQFCGSKMEELV